MSAPASSATATASPSGGAVRDNKKTPTLSKKERREQQQLAKLRKTRLKNAPRFIVMVGLPASGKSTFAQQLEASSDGAYVRVCQDELGSRKATEDLCSKVVLGGKNNVKRCIVDGCNVTTTVRKRWLDIAMNPAKGAVAIHYTTPAEECKRRAAVRTGHPSGDLFQWGGNTIIDTKAKNLVVPTTDEGFERVYQVSNMEEANSLLFALGGSSFDESQIASFTARDESQDEEEESQQGAAASHSFELCRESDVLNADIAIQRLGLKDEDVDNIYVYGSRLWGTTKPDGSSDFDLIIVCKNDVPKKATHVGSIMDAVIMGRQEFNNKLEAGDFLVTLCCFYLPPVCIWRQRFDPKGKFQLHPSILCNKVLEDLDKNLLLAAKHYHKGTIPKAKKILSYMIRMVLLTAQIINLQDSPAVCSNASQEEEECPLDIAAANRYYDDIMNHQDIDNSWDSFLQLVEPSMKECRELLETRKNASAAVRRGDKKGSTKKTKNHSN